MQRTLTGFFMIQFRDRWTFVSGRTQAFPAAAADMQSIGRCFRVQERIERRPEVSGRDAPETNQAVARRGGE
jgi:hypothetical protein